MLLSSPVFQPIKETLLREGQFKLKIKARRAACDRGIPRRNLRVSRSKCLKSAPVPTPLRVALCPVPGDQIHRHRSWAK